MYRTSTHARFLLILVSILTTDSAIATDVSDAKIRKTLVSKADTIARSLRWPRVANPRVTESKIGKGHSMYQVLWQGGYIYFSPEFWPRFCTKADSRRMGPWNTKPSLPTLSPADVKRAQAIARHTCNSLGLGSITSFKEIVARRTHQGMYFPVIAIECRMKVVSSIPVHELAIPTVSIEIEPKSWVVNYVSASLPVVVEPLKLKEDKETAKKLIADYAKKQYGLELKTASMKVDLYLLDWHEGDENSLESKRRRSVRRWMIPIYRYVEPRVGEIWFNANTMKLLGVRANHPQAPSYRNNPPP